MSVRIQDVKSAIDELNDAQTAFLADASAKIEKQDEHLEGFLDRLEEIESRSSSPGRTGDSSRQTQEQKAHREKFLKWLRAPQDPHAKAALLTAEASVNEQKAVVTTTGSAGGFAVPESISQDIERRVALQNPFRQLVTVRTIGTSDFHELVDLHDDASGWVGEGGARNETATPGLRDIQPTMGTIYAYPKASEESVADVFFDVEGWLTESASDSFAAQEAIAIVTGDGTSKPTGFLNTTPVTTPDDASPLRAAAALKYEPVLTGSPAALSADLMIGVPQSPKEKYLMGDGVAWVMHRTALTAVRQLKDSSGRFVWSESLQPAVPGTLLGFPAWTSDAMDAVGANNFPIAFGNWRRGYVLVDRVGLRITVDDNITTPGQVKFYIRRRVGGIVRNNDALRALRWATT